MTNGKKLVEAKVEAQARETLHLNGKSYSTISTRRLVFNNVVYRRKGRLFMWITDDADRIPVQFRLQMGFPVGRLRSNSKNTSGFSSGPTRRLVILMSKSLRQFAKDPGFQRLPSRLSHWHLRPTSRFSALCMPLFFAPYLDKQADRVAVLWEASLRKAFPQTGRPGQQFRIGVSKAKASRMWRRNF